MYENVILFYQVIIIKVTITNVVILSKKKM